MLKKMLLMSLLSTMSISSLKPVSAAEVFEYLKSDTFLNSYRCLFLELALCGGMAYFLNKGLDHIQSQNEMELMLKQTAEAAGQTYPTTPLREKIFCKNSLNFVAAFLFITTAAIPMTYKNCKNYYKTA